jgi:hypothetical protein
MVLENDAWGENPPPSDDDAYGSGSDSPRKVLLSMEGLPKPMPIFGRLFGYNEKMMAKAMQFKSDNASTVLGRNLSTDELNAFAYWTAKQISIMSYGPPLGTIGGAWRAYNTRDTIRFPFYQPNMETFNKEIFPNARFPMLRGNRALYAWHALRTFWYVVAGEFFSQMFFGSYSMSVTAVGEMSDPRLKPYVDAVRKQSAQKRGSLPVPGQPQQKGPPRPIPQQKQDDASPTGGMGGGYPDIPKEEPQWMPPPQSRPEPAQAREPEPQSQPFDVFGDSSPAPTQQGRIPDTQAPRQQSTWERLRRGGKPAPIDDTRTGGWDNVRKTQGSGASDWAKQQEQTQKEQRQGATLGESYTYSKTDEERNYAKDEAQKEFDARIEEERRGGDFSAGTNKRW